MRKLWLISYIGLHSEKNVLPIQREGDVLVHGDFSLNHLLFDQNQMVCSVLDFGDSHVGDFQEDFLYLLDEEDEEAHTRNLPAVSNRNQEVATCTKTKPKTLRVKRAQKQGNAPDFRQKQPKAGAFQVLEGKMAVETGCQQVRKDIQGPMEDYTS